MEQSIVRTIQAAIQPLDIESVANYLRTDGDAEGEHLDDLINMAAAEVERITGRVMLSSTFRLQQATWVDALQAKYTPPVGQERLPHTLELPRTPLRTVTSVKYYDTDNVQQTLDAAQYIVCTDLEPGLVYLKSENDWPALAERPDAVQVIFTAGHGTTLAEIPARLKMAMLLLCREYYAGGSPNTSSTSSDAMRAMDIINGYKVGGWTL